MTVCEEDDLSERPVYQINPCAMTVLSSIEGGWAWLRIEIHVALTQLRCMVGDLIKHTHTHTNAQHENCNCTSTSDIQATHT